MATDYIRYDILTQNALRGVVRAVLADAASKGLPGDHHFFISFDTRAEGVRMSPRLREQYPEEMTIVLQHQFWDLTVDDDVFDVGLSFNGVPERLTVPLAAIADVVEPVPMGDASTPGPFAFGDPDHVRRVMGDAGYADIRITSQAVDFVVGGGLPYDESLDFLVEHGLLRHVLGSAAPAVRVAARDRLADALEAYERPDGVHMASAVWMVTARGS